jgi:CxxC motif-containing protein (DUF1111 family)
MRVRTDNPSASARWLRGGWMVFWIAVVAFWEHRAWSAPPPGGEAASRSEGKDLFLREWSFYDERSPAGDGLGPVFNERSCFACHRLGGPGGAGANEKNVSILAVRGSRSLDKEQLESLANVHPAFRQAKSVVLHRFGPDPDYELWRWKVMGVERDRIVRHSGVLPRSVQVDGTPGIARVERNTPPIFGAGRIDAIPDSAIEEAARRNALGDPAHFPEIKGRPSRLSDGRIGRFGWKGQVATLEDFVLSACAGELGLTAPGHPQPPDPRKRDEGNYPPGLDLSPTQAAALVAYVRELPEPVVARPRNWHLLCSATLGKAVFSNIGCAGCHTPQLGPVDGLYSDLLLHDMGPGDSEAGQYYGEPKTTNPPLLATPQEWRTPPLWGLSASGPFMHDGQSSTIAQAISRHGGEAAKTVQRFDQLRKSQQRALCDFLLSLAAPPANPGQSALPHPRVSHIPGEPLFGFSYGTVAHGAMP